MKISWYIAFFYMFCIGYAVYYSHKSTHFLTDIGKENIRKVIWWSTLAKKEYFNEEGLKYRRRANLIGILGFIIFAILWVLDILSQSNYK